MYVPLREWPKTSMRPEDILLLRPHPFLAFDAEWSIKTGTPTIIGVSDGDLSVSCSWEDGFPYFQELWEREPQAIFCGHNVMTADLRVLANYGMTIPPERVEDSIIRWYLVAQHLCKTTKKAGLEEDAGEKRGRGLMNLGTFSSIYTNLSYWKECVGEEQCLAEDRPCSTHKIFAYNSMDAAAVALAMPEVIKTCKLRGVDKLYPMHRNLASVLAGMSERGMLVDVPYVEQLRADFERQKVTMKEEFPFNPNSGKQVLEYFKKNFEIELSDNQEGTIRSAVEDYPECLELDQLLVYKELGNGPDRWFAPREWDTKKQDWVGFVDEQGYIHSRFGFYTSSARLMASDPNLQNVPVRRIDRRNCECGRTIREHNADCPCKKFRGVNIGTKIRRAIISPPGFFLGKSDFSNGENRVYLYLAGYEPPEGDFHSWMVENIELKEQDEFAVKLGGARQAAKSVVHGADYLEGLQLKTLSELRSPRCLSEIKNGARLVFKDWTFEGKVVTFTGVNLAKRAFGTASMPNRAKALAVVERYFARFPKLRDLQKRITKQCEKEKVVRPPNGYCLLSYGLPEDRLKTAAAVWGSQPLAHLSKLALLELDRRRVAGGILDARAQIHDELLVLFPEGSDPKTACAELVDCMSVPVPEMPGFKIPCKPSYGRNWADQTEVKL